MSFVPDGTTITVVTVTLIVAVGSHCYPRSRVATVVACSIFVSTVAVTLFGCCGPLLIRCFDMF